jgi:acyl carrier protein
MVPAAYVRLESMPLTVNGKLDRQALPAPGNDAYALRKYEAPHGQVEQELAEIWAKLLRVKQVGRQDNFFELGGHSLLATRVVQMIYEHFEINIDLGEIFELPTLSQLAAEIRSNQLAQFDPRELASVAKKMGA